MELGRSEEVGAHAWHILKHQEACVTGAWCVCGASDRRPAPQVWEGLGLFPSGSEETWRV